MKRFNYLATTLGVVIVLFLVDAPGAIWEGDDLYLNTDVGVVFQQDATQILKSPGGGTIRHDIKFHPGIRGDIGLGYNINNHWSAKVETGVIWTSYDMVGNNKLSSNGNSVDLYQIPLLANVIYRLPLGERWTSYAGIGLGGVLSVYDFTLFDFTGSLNHTYGTETDIAFAYQAETGVKYSLAENISFGICYKFFSSMDQNWNLNLHGVNAPVSLKGIYTHSIVASFAWTF